MSRKRTSKISAGSFESTLKPGDSFTRVYGSMLHHPTFTTLKPRQKILYVYIKSQLYGKRKPAQDYKGLGLYQDDTKYFYYNHAVAVADGLYTKSNHGDFYKDMQELEHRGFIKKVSSGKAQRQKNVYIFSDEWQHWEEKV